MTDDAAFEFVGQRIAMISYNDAGVELVFDTGDVLEITLKATPVFKRERSAYPPVDLDAQ